MVPNFRRGNMHIQVGAPVINNVNRRVSIREANGRREIEHVENGKTTKIVKNPNGSIEAETTEKQNGKDVTKKVEAKDLEDLKKKDPDAAKIFEQFTPNGAGNIQIQPGFAPDRFGIPNLPAALPDRPGVPNLPADIIEQQLKSLDRLIERVKANAPNNPAAQ